MVEEDETKDSIHHVYAALANDIQTREQELRDDLPVETTANIHAHLRGVVADWDANRKSLRTVPVCHAYARQLDTPLEDSIKRLLTGLDASVNALDDIIDTKDLAMRDRIALTVNVAFSSVLIAENCPTDTREAIRDLLREYFTALFQIPLVEQDLFTTMKDATTAEQRQRAAEQIYAYRARDIDAFAGIPAITANLDAETERQLLRDLRTYRARRLLFKDIYDVERDIADDDVTPVIHLLRQYESIGDVADAVEGLYLRFSYSEGGDVQYGGILRELERPPDDLRSLLQNAAQYT